MYDFGGHTMVRSCLFHFQMMTSYGSDGTVTRLLDRYDWYLMPVYNPDGYVYSHVYTPYCSESLHLQNSDTANPSEIVLFFI